MAYNLQSLITILQQILNPQQSRWIVDHNKPQLQSLLQKTASLQQILEKSSLTSIESLENQIREAAHRAEDIIESQMVAQMLSSPEVVSFTFSTPDLQQVMQQLDSVMEQVVRLAKVKTMSSGTSSSGASQLQDPSSKSVVVGVGEDLMQLKDRLTGTQSKLEILPIVGMGGIGKTTLALQLYQHPLIVEHFEYARAWTTVSQDYNMRAILLDLLRCIIGKELDGHIEKETNELKVVLYQSLYGRRYIIVLDDIWSTKFWDDIRMYFPDNNNTSRIVITTRESDVAKYADSKSQHHQVQLLNKSESWNLFRQIVFGEEDCPHELQVIGEKISNDCGGLPLAISVIAGMLSKVERSKDVWENIGNNVRAAIGESDKQFSNILSLSYNHLPLHLKPCFLYMAAFPEDYKIKASRLICMWIGEGFVKSNGDKSLEEEAEDYVKSLVERNLISVRSYHWYGKAKRYSMHDLLRDLCMRKADDEKFLCVKNAPEVEVTFSNLRRVSFHTPYGVEDDEYASSEMSLSRSFLLFIKLDRTIPPFVFKSSLLRVLDLLEMYMNEFPREILQLVNLRYLGVYCHSLPSSGISRLCNLQTLIAKLYRYSYWPADLWEMSDLRHLFVFRTELQIEEDYMKKIVLQKLQTIWSVKLSRAVIRGGFLESIPNIKSLGIYYEPELSEVVDLTHLHKLQTLRCYLRYTPLRGLKFPSTLRKLSLVGCLITPAAMTAVCALPNLEMLKISRCDFQSKDTYEEWLQLPYDQEWEAAEGDEFRSLQFLQLDRLQLVRWRADETNFPRLRHLIIQSCYYLEEIPAGIGEILTLQLIHLEDCNDSVVASAKQIQEEQQSEYENYDIQLRII